MLDRLAVPNDGRRHLTHVRPPCSLLSRLAPPRASLVVRM
jgi:hypothetical protein